MRVERADAEDQPGARFKPYRTGTAYQITRIGSPSD